MHYRVVKPARFFVNIHLDPSHVIPVVLKDVLAATYDITSRLNDLLAGTPGGPPGKLYVPDVLQLVKTGGSCARIALIDESTAEHKNCFDQLRLELEGGKLVRWFILFVQFGLENDLFRSSSWYWDLLPSSCSPPRIYRSARGCWSPALYLASQRR